MSFLDVTNAQEPSFEPVPAGEYILQVEEAEVRDTKDMTGQYISAKLTIIGGEYDNRKVFVMYNIKNKNQKAVEIGMGQLKALMKSAGMQNFVLNSVGELCGLTFGAKLGIKRSEEYDDKNVIKSYLPYNPAIAQKANVSTAGNFGDDTIPF